MSRREWWFLTDIVPVIVEDSEYRIVKTENAPRKSDPLRGRHEGADLSWWFEDRLETLLGDSCG